MNSTPAEVRISGCGLALAVLAALLIVSPVAQERTSDQLVERLRQIQGQLEQHEGQPSAQSSAGAEELIREIEVIERQLRPEPAPQGPALSEEEVRSLVREGLGVDVLRARTVEHDGRQVYALTVMNPPGDDNAAFMVRTLLVDGTTGGLLGEVPHTPRAAGADVSSRAAAAGPESTGPEIRRRTYR